MIIPVSFKTETIKNNNIIRISNNYICTINTPCGYLFDKKEQRVIHTDFLTEENKQEKVNYIINEYGINNITFSEDDIRDIALANIEKKPNIRLHIKRVAQVYECLDKFNIDLELEAKFDIKNNQSIIYLFDDNISGRYSQTKIVYDFLTGIFTLYKYNQYINKSLILEILLINKC